MKPTPGISEAVTMALNSRSIRASPLSHAVRQDILFAQEITDPTLTLDHLIGPRRLCRPA